MKISKTQQDIINKMRNGWELGISLGASEGCWIQQGELGKGGISETVSFATVRALENKGLIKYGERKFPLQRIELAIASTKEA